ncbi:ankyrin repeat domain-containing protein [Paenibacillus sp. GCM10027626]|uniref:ankyrin repeat domain-containing protein n=1 Tax=Paenibacillus sp. GCM10027626 TaxID=3273411 RepID=UPI00362B5BA0
MESAVIIEDLFRAAQNGDTILMKGKISEHPELVHTLNNDGLHLLGYAAHFGQIEAVKLLLDHDADVNELSQSKVSYIPSNTALHAAIAGKRDIEVIRLLLERGANTNLYDSNGHTCLHTAAYHNSNEAIIRLLLEHGAELNGRSGGGETALAVALEQGNECIVELLHQLGSKQ